MTMEDDFDAKLAVAFARADGQVSASQEFVKQLLRHLGRADRQRWILLGFAASAGALIAGSQLQQIANEFVTGSEVLEQILTGLSPQTIISMALAVIMVMFGLVLPATNR